MGSGERGMNPVAMVIINPWKEYWPGRGSNQRPPVLKSCMLPTEPWGLAVPRQKKMDITDPSLCDDCLRVIDQGLVGCLVICVYLSSLPIAHLSYAPRRRVVVTGDGARIQDETTGSSAWFFNVLGV